MGLIQGDVLDFSSNLRQNQYRQEHKEISKRKPLTQFLDQQKKTTWELLCYFIIFTILFIVYRCYDIKLMYPFD